MPDVEPTQLPMLTQLLTHGSESAEEHLRLISASTDVRKELFQWTQRRSDGAVPLISASGEFDFDRLNPRNEYRYISPYEVSRSQEHSVSISQEHSVTARISEGDADPMDTAGLRNLSIVLSVVLSIVSASIMLSIVSSIMLSIVLSIVFMMSIVSVNRAVNCVVNRVLSIVLSIVRCQSCL